LSTRTVKCERLCEIWGSHSAERGFCCFHHQVVILSHQIKTPQPRRLRL